MVRFVSKKTYMVPSTTNIMCYLMKGDVLSRRQVFRTGINLFSWSLILRFIERKINWPLWCMMTIMCLLTFLECLLCKFFLIL